MKRLYFILLVIIPSSLFAQFKTEYHQNGDPKTEIIDADGMKQGTWNYYDFNDNLIRIEKFKDNQLIKRTSIVNGIEFDTQSFSIIEINVPSNLLEIETTIQQSDGEIIIDEQGNILSIYFYSLASSLNKNDITIALSNFIKSNYTNTKNTILTF
jgi:antitoxin component YwqK of YwqJK toxin-antitoxin module